MTVRLALGALLVGLQREGVRGDADSRALMQRYQNMAEDHTCKGVGECHPYREFEGMQPSR